MMTQRFQDRPNSFPLPPVLLAAFLVGGLVLKAYVPALALSFEPGMLAWGGWALVGLALMLDGWAFSEFRRHKTNVMPTRPAEALVSSGPFGFSRNPIYLGNVILLAGVGLLAGAGLLFLFAAANAVILDRTQIRREEAHLAARFGEAWQDYAARVRRWI